MHSLVEGTLKALGFGKACRSNWKISVPWHEAQINRYQSTGISKLTRSVDIGILFFLDVKTAQCERLIRHLVIGQVNTTWCFSYIPTSLGKWSLFHWDTSRHVYSLGGAPNSINGFHEGQNSFLRHAPLSANPVSSGGGVHPGVWRSCRLDPE